MRTSRIRAIILSVPFVVGAVSCTQPTSPSPLVSARVDTGITADARPGGSDTHDSAAVPFKGTFDASLTMSTPLPFPLLSNLIEGAGTATHLGRFTLRIPHVVNRTTRVGTGTYEFVAANGDVLIADFSGQATPIAPGVLSSLDTAVIRSGTGRFSEATGSFTVERVFVMSSGHVTGEFAGSIVRPK